MNPLAFRIAFDVRPGEACLTGIGRYARTMAPLVQAARPGSAFTLGRDADLRFTPRSAVEEAQALPLLLEDEGIDLYHSPLGASSGRLGCRLVTTLHDAIPATRPELCAPGFEPIFAEAVQAARRSDRVVCPSEAAREDLVASLGLDRGRLRVVPETAAACFFETPRATATSTEPYVLVVGSLEARKNPGVVLDALALLGHEAPRVVFVGPRAGFPLEREAAARGVESRVHVAGILPDAELVRLLDGARALVFPSRAEGFGLPVLEAFARGTPVVASKIPAVVEVARDAALLFDPEDAEQLAAGLAEVLASSELRACLARRGAARLAARYSPEAVTKALRALYDELEAEPRGRRVSS